MKNKNLLQNILFCLGPRLVSGSSDNTLQLFNVESETKIGSIHEDHTGYQKHASLGINKSGNLIVSACGEKVMKHVILKWHLCFCLFRLVKLLSA